MEVTVDMAVVGGGPAGSTLAALLASRGVTVALIERDSFPRDKVCGEFLSYDALPIADLLDLTSEIDSRGSPWIRRCRIAGRRRSYEFAMPEPSRGVSRCVLDHLLFRTAVARGAHDWSGWSADRIDTRSVAVSRGEETRTIAANAIVGAWGRWGRFDTQLRRPFVRDRAHRSFGFKRHYRAIGAHDPETILLHSFERGYLGVSDVEGRLTNICGLVHASRLAQHRGRWESFVENLRSAEPALDRMYAAHAPAQDAFLSSEPVVFRAKNAVEQGIFMCGDASGIVDPLTGNGMAIAMQSALLAAPLLLRLTSSPGHRAAIEREYIGRYAAMFNPRIAWSRRIAGLLSRPAALDQALRFVRGNTIGDYLTHRTRGDRDEIARMVDAWAST